MQTDFHFYAIYALARCAGVAADKAKTIAYASQYTDDADDGRTITFKNGESFNPVLTAHKSLSFANLTLDVQKKIHLSFHFLPGLLSEDKFPRRAFVTRAGCKLAEDTVSFALSNMDKEEGLQGAGIALHSFADTYSHEGFSGLLGPENDTESVDISEKGGIQKALGKLWHRIMESMVPCIGHGELLYLPDTPYCTWSYFDYYRQKEINNIDNHAKCMVVSERIYSLLGGNEWSRVADRFSDAFRYEGSLEARCNNWKSMISNGLFSFAPTPEDRTLAYDPYEWKNNALVWRDNGGISKLAAFEASDFVKFHAAARKQRSFVLGEVEKTGIKIEKAAILVFLWKFIGFFHSLFSTKGRSSFTFKAIRRAAFRFFIYGSMMLAGEIAFYTICKIGRSIPLTVINDLFRFEPTFLTFFYGSFSSYLNCFFLFPCIAHIIYTIFV